VRHTTRTAIIKRFQTKTPSRYWLLRRRPRECPLILGPSRPEPRLQRRAAKTEEPEGAPPPERCPAPARRSAGTSRPSARHWSCSRAANY
jgi:hypothetical protein